MVAFVEQIDFTGHSQATPKLGSQTPSAPETESWRELKKFIARGKLAGEVGRLARAEVMALRATIGKGNVWKYVHLQAKPSLSMAVKIERLTGGKVSLVGWNNV